VREKVSKPKFADGHLPLDESDEIAALTSVQIALSRVGDGTTFAWRRTNGRLSGAISPTASFRNASGSICRHFVVLLTTGFKTKKAEGVACRLANGRWQLEG
jgi:surface antigen